MYFYKIHAKQTTQVPHIYPHHISKGRHASIPVTVSPGHRCSPTFSSQNNLQLSQNKDSSYEFLHFEVPAQYFMMYLPEKYKSFMVIFICVALTYGSIITLTAISFLHHNAHTLEDKHQKAKRHLCSICNYLACKNFWHKNESTAFGTTLVFLDC